MTNVLTCETCGIKIDTDDHVTREFLVGALLTHFDNEEPGHSFKVYEIKGQPPKILSGVFVRSGQEVPNAG